MLRYLLAVALLLATMVSAASVCRNKDCSDVVGHGMVKDNLGHSKHFTERHHEDWKEEHRVRRINILRRERPSM